MVINGPDGMEQSKPRQYNTIVVDRKAQQQQLLSVVGNGPASLGSETSSIKSFRHDDTGSQGPGGSPPQVDLTPPPPLLLPPPQPQAAAAPPQHPLQPPAAVIVHPAHQQSSQPPSQMQQPKSTAHKSKSRSSSRGKQRQQHSLTQQPLQAPASTHSRGSHSQGRRGRPTAAAARLPRMPASSTGHTPAELEPDRDQFPFCLLWTPLPLVSWFLPLIGHTGVSDSRGLISDFAGDFSVARDNFTFGSPSKFYPFDPDEIDLRAAHVTAASVASTASHSSSSISSTSDLHSSHSRLSSSGHKAPPAAAAAAAVDQQPNRPGVRVSAAEWQAVASGRDLDKRALIWDRAIAETSEYYKRHRYDLYFRNCHAYIACVLNKCNYAHSSDWTPTDVWWMVTFMSSYVGAGGFLRQWLPFLALVLTLLVVLAILL